MKTVYLDSNIVHYYVRGFPARPAGREAQERAALEGALLRHPELRFVASAWNLIEAAGEQQPGLSREALAEQYASFYERLGPLFLPAHNIVVGTYVFA